MSFLRAVTFIAKLASMCVGMLLIYWLLLKVTGHSPTSDQIIITGFGALATCLLAIAGVLLRIVGELRELKGQFVQHVKHCDADIARIHQRMDK